MTRNEFFDKVPEGWFSVGRFSDISATEDGQREFLEAINDFRLAENEGQIPVEGYEMPDAGGTAVGNIIAIDFIADRPLLLGSYTDGLIVVKHPEVSN